MSIDISKIQPGDSIRVYISACYLDVTPSQPTGVYETGVAEEVWENDGRVVYVRPNNRTGLTGVHNRIVAHYPAELKDNQFADGSQRSGGSMTSSTVAPIAVCVST